MKRRLTYEEYNAQQDELERAQSARRSIKQEGSPRGSKSGSPHRRKKQTLDDEDDRQFSKAPRRRRTATGAPAVEEVQQDEEDDDQSQDESSGDDYRDQWLPVNQRPRAKQSRSPKRKPAPPGSSCDEDTELAAGPRRKESAGKRRSPAPTKSRKGKPLPLPRGAGPSRQSEPSSSVDEELEEERVDTSVRLHRWNWCFCKFQTSDTPPRSGASRRGCASGAFSMNEMCCRRAPYK